jgi:hypothetical protein
MKLLGRRTTAAAACAACLLTISLFATTPSNAGSIPAWLDDSITSWNTNHPDSPVLFVAIKDSYVWYEVAASPGLGSKEIRARIYGIAYKNGYADTQDEEIVTTGKPPTTGPPAKQRKCWTRSFLRDVQKGSSTSVERMLTTLVCEDGENWAAGFRILQ